MVTDSARMARTHMFPASEEVSLDSVLGSCMHGIYIVTFVDVFVTYDDDDVTFNDAIRDDVGGASRVISHRTVVPSEALFLLRL